MSDRETDPAAQPPNDASLIRHDEELAVSTRTEEIGSVRLRKRIETDRVRDELPRQIEEADVERVPPTDGDSGEILTLEDGSVSVPVLEEELVVMKRTVVRERIIVRKRTTTTTQSIDTTLRHERVEIEGDAAIDVPAS